MVQYIFAIDNALAPGYCVYAHEVDGIIVYIGSGTISRAFAVLPRDRTNEWRAATAGKSVRVGVLSWHADKSEAMRAEYAATKEWQPVANLSGRQPRHSPGFNPQWGRQVRCLETGQIFPSCTAAGKAIGVTQGAVTNVARGRYPAVKGFRFEYV